MHLSTTERRDYPWNEPGAPDRFVLAPTQHPDSHAALRFVADPTHFTQCVQFLARSKAPGPDGIPNELLRALPNSTLRNIHDLFTIMWARGETPAEWTVPDIVLLPKPGAEQSLRKKDKRARALANTTYKLWTRLITLCLTQTAEQIHVDSTAQEGFVQGRNTERQFLNVIHAIEDAAISGLDLCVRPVRWHPAAHHVARSLGHVGRASPWKPHR